MIVFYELLYYKPNNYYANKEIFFEKIKLDEFVKSFKNEKIDSIIKYYTIYEHTKNFIFQPIIENIYGQDMETYLENYKLKKEDLLSIKVKDYKNNLILKNNNYLIEYIVIGYHPYTKLYNLKLSVNYSSNNLKDIQNQLRSLSKSTQVFNIKLFQYQKLKKEEI